MKSIKSKMKARAGILIMLICMISLTGFGQTTSDLIQNSETKAVVSSMEPTELASVVNQTPIYVNAFNYQAEDYQMEVKRFKDNECEYLMFGKAMPKASTNSLNTVNDVGWRTNLIDNRQPTYVKNVFMRSDHQRICAKGSNYTSVKITATGDNLIYKPPCNGLRMI